MTGPGVGIVEAVKLADDRSGDVIVRLYEPLGAHGTVHITPSFPATITRTDLLENPIPPTAATVPDVEPAADLLGVDLKLRPFEIVTLRFSRHLAMTK